MKGLRKTSLILLVGLVLLCLLAFLFYSLYHKNAELRQYKEQLVLDKELLLEEYNELSMQYEGYKFSLSNDSLIAKLETEQAKVQQLMQELKTVKRDNATRITELKRELQSLRKIMRHYVAQIDSLNQINQSLQAENEVVKHQISEVSGRAAQLEEEKTELTEKVKRAAKLNISAIEVALLDRRDRKTKRSRRAKKIEVNFRIDKNITAETGERMLYLRILKPDGEILSSGMETFFFENTELQFSAKRRLLYEGDALSTQMYWDISEYLQDGDYRADIFSDGYLIGQKNFTID